MGIKDIHEVSATPAIEGPGDIGKNAMMGKPPEAATVKPVDQGPTPITETTESKTDLPDKTFTDAKNRHITIRAHNNADHHMIRAYDRSHTPEVPANASASNAVSFCDLNEEKVLCTNQNTGELEKRTDRVKFNIDTPQDAYKKSGIGGRMIEAAEEVSRKTGAREMYGNFSPNPGKEKDLKAFYEKHGFSLREVNGGKEVYKTFFFQ
jgi:hypothetical protein